MEEAVRPDADQEDTVLSVPEDRLVKAFGGGRGTITLDLTTPDREYGAHLFPVNRIFGSAERREDSAAWRQAYSKHWQYDADRIRLYDEFERAVIKRFEQYQVPVIELKKETPKEAVCLVFERVNRGGVALTVFELLTATFAADNFQLRDDWNARERRLKTGYPVLRNLQSTDYLQAISLLVTQERRLGALAHGASVDKAPGISCKHKDILKLDVADWQDWADRVEQGFVRTAKFLHGQKIFKARDLPYRTQLVPLAAIFARLGNAGETEGAWRKIARWYWCGVLGELYGGAIESRFARDLPEVGAMVQGESVEPVTIAESSFQAGRLLTLRTRNSSAYKGLYALLMRDGGRDFRTGVPIEASTFLDERIDIHHIFPERWCKSAGAHRHPARDLQQHHQQDRHLCAHQSPDRWSRSVGIPAGDRDRRRHRTVAHGPDPGVALHRAGIPPEGRLLELLHYARRNAAPANRDGDWQEDHSRGGTVRRRPSSREL